MHHFLSSRVSIVPEGFLWSNHVHCRKVSSDTFAMSKIICKPCGLEKDESEAVDGCRCLLCNALRIRLYRKASNLEKEHFQKLLVPKREDSYQKNSDTINGDLSVALTAAIKEVVTESEESQFKGSGTFLDEEDLIEKYKNKPGRAAKIMKNVER